MDTAAVRRLAVRRQAIMPEHIIERRIAAMLTISPAVMLMPVTDMTAATMPPYMP